MKITLTPVFLVTLTVGTLMAGSVTIGFGSLSQTGTGMVSEGGSVSSDGFTFTSADDAFDIWAASNPNLPSLSTADTSLFEFFAGSTTTVSDGGTAFSLSSIDLAPVIAGGTGSFTVQFIGTRADSSTVSQTFTVNDSTPTALTTFDFSGFTDLVNVEFSQGTNIGFFETQDTAYQFDNVVVSTSAAIVPEPSALPLLSAGCIFLLVAFSIKRTTGINAE